MKSNVYIDNAVGQREIYHSQDGNIIKARDLVKLEEYWMVYLHFASCNREGWTYHAEKGSKVRNTTLISVDTRH